MSKRVFVGGLAILVVAFAVLGATYLWTAGSAVVVDEVDGVEDAFIVTTGSREQRLSEIWNGYYYAIPQFEGIIRVRCRDGSIKEMGYVTAHMDMKIRVKGKAPCALVAELL